MHLEPPAPGPPAAFEPAAALRAALRRLTLLGGALIALMAGFRLAFAIRYAPAEVWREFSGALPKAFAVGLLHDQRIVLLFLLPPMLSLLWMREAGRARWERWLRWARAWCLVGILLLVTILIADFVFYSYFLSHFSVLAWGFIEDDLRAVAVGAWKTYPIPLYLGLIAAFAWLLTRILRRTWSVEGVLNPRTPRAAALGAESRLNVQLTLHVLATVVLLTWSFSPSPARMAANLPSSGFMHQLPPNGVEKLANAVWLRMTEQPFSMAERFGYADRRADALRDFSGLQIEDRAEAAVLDLLPPQPMLPRPHVATPPHVVLVVMESFATHLLRWQSEDFDLLGPLAPYWATGWVFPRFLPSDMGSAGSIVSLTVNLPYRPGTKHLSQSERIAGALPTSSALAFARHGYEARFLYGGPLDWRDLGEFLPRQGFIEVAGQDEILAERNLQATAAGEWGVWDEHLFAAAARRLREAQKPQFLILFTTTNHPPHELPAAVQLPALEAPPELLQRVGKLSEVQHKQIRTYQYACHEFGGFLRQLEEEGLLERTVVAATGDHTIGMGIPFPSQEVLLERAVPLLLLAPEAIRAQFQPDLKRPGSHQDVIPTLLHVSGNGDGSFRGIGGSLLDQAHFAYGYNPGGLLISEEAILLEFDSCLGAMRWSDSGIGVLPCEETSAHRDLLLRCRAGLALTDWILSEAAPLPLEQAFAE
jgi:phosphoglycerol transferase MdoB-like AlkP superfamily enzyme